MINKIVLCFKYLESSVDWYLGPILNRAVQRLNNKKEMDRDGKRKKIIKKEVVCNGRESNPGLMLNR